MHPIVVHFFVGAIGLEPTVLPLAWRHPFVALRHFPFQGNFPSQTKVCFPLIKGQKPVVQNKKELSLTSLPIGIFIKLGFQQVEFSFAHAKQIELNFILCYNKLTDK